MQYRAPILEAYLTSRDITGVGSDGWWLRYEQRCLGHRSDGGWRYNKKLQPRFICENIFAHSALFSIISIWCIGYRLFMAAYNEWFHLFLSTLRH